MGIGTVLKEQRIVDAIDKKRNNDFKLLNLNIFDKRLRLKMFKNKKNYLIISLEQWNSDPEMPLF